MNAPIVSLPDLNPESPTAKSLLRFEPGFKKAPTDRQRRVLRFIHEYFVAEGAPPTLREIGAHMGIRSTNGVADHLRSLERRGLIVKRDMLTRGIRVTIQGLAVLGVDPDAVSDAPPGAPRRTDASVSLELEIRAARAENARLRVLLHRVLGSSMVDLPQALTAIRKELGE